MAKLSKELRMEIHNHFDIEVVDVKTGKVKQKAQAFNVVCNSYFDRVANNQPCTYIVFGSGSGTPAATDTSLFHYEGYATDASTYSPYDVMDSSQQQNGIWRRQLKRTIPNTSYVGVTITEMGLSASTSNGYLVTHAMLQDMNGNPISIEHTSTDIISIYCTIYVHYAGQDSDIHILSDSTPSIPDRVALFKASNMEYAFCQIEGMCGNNHRAMSSASGWTNMGNKTLKMTTAQVPVSSGNFGGIGMIGVGRYYSGGSGYSSQTNWYASVVIETGRTTIPPSRITGEVAGTGDGTVTKFSTKFHNPKNATVYVNGVAQATGVTVKEARCTAYNKTSIYNYDASDYVRWVFFDKPSVARPKAWSSMGSNYCYQIQPSEAVRVGVREPGIFTFTNVSTGDIECSDDGVNWRTAQGIGNSNVQMDENDSHCLYYRNKGSAYAVLWVKAHDGYNIIFDNPPANGDVITIDYTTDYIPKDSDHVLDIEMTITFGEYTSN